MTPQKNQVILISPPAGGAVLRGTSYSNPLIIHLIKILRRKFKKKFRGSAPLNILSLGTCLKKAGYEPVLIDGACQNIKYMLARHLGPRTLFVGISSMTSYQIIGGLKAAKFIRKLNPQLPIVWGGLHPTILPEETLKTSPYVDIACKGEGEETIVELAHHFSHKGIALQDIRGISFKDPQKGIIHNADRDLLNLDHLAPMDYSLLDQDLYDLSFLSYQSSRGCPYRCRFCSLGPINQYRYRFRSGPQIIADVEDILKKYPIRDISFIDDHFFVDLQRARYFANAILEKGLKFRWRAMCRADISRKTDVEFWKLMKKSGLNIVCVGAESGSQRILDDMRKSYKVSDITSITRQLNEAEIANGLFFMCGFPKETMEDIQATYQMAKDLPKTFKHTSVFEIFYLLPLPKTEYQDEFRSHGVVFPSTLEGWGHIRSGDYKFHTWNPLHKYCFRLAMASRWHHPVPWKPILVNFAKLNIPVALMYLCGKVQYYRWEHAFFKFPVDSSIQRWLNNHIFKASWQK